MKKNTLLHTNVIVCIIITMGFIVTSVIGYQSNTSIFERDVEHVSTLAAEGIYYQIDKILSEPVNVSLTMANDSLLKNFLGSELQHLNDADYTKKLQEYLYAYREKYAYDSVFLVSVPTNRYYHFNGIDRILVPDSAENVWYYEFLNSSDEYSLNIDNDEAVEDDSITVFVNCKIKDENGTTIGIIGVGLKVDSLQTLLKEYDEKFDVMACLVDDSGVVQLSSDKTGYERISLFDDEVLVEFKDSILGKEEAQKTFWHTSPSSKGYVVAQYVPSLKWHLVVENDMTIMNHQLQEQLYTGIGIICLIIIFVLFTITRVLKQYRAQIVKLSLLQKLEYQELLDQATEALYDNIFEIDVTHNRASGENAQRYFGELGMDLDTPYDEALRAIADQRVKKDYAQGYLDMFLPERIIESYGSGINNLNYDFLISNSDEDYHWIRSIGRIFYWESDESIRMISFRKNIDEEKKRELLLLEKSQKDALSGLYNKGATEHAIENIFKNNGTVTGKHVLLIVDIDDLKNINDQYGHAFGDSVVNKFAAELNVQFRDSDIIGRIGGDEFAVLMIDCTDMNVLREKLEQFCGRIIRKDFGQEENTAISCSVGAVMYPEHGATYAELYEKADQALYYAKAHGKRSFHILGVHTQADEASRVDSRMIRELLETTTNGVAKFACTDSLKLLYFNQKLLDLVGSSARILSELNFESLAAVHPDDLPKVMETLQKSQVRRTSIEAAFRLRHHDGHYIPVKLRGVFANELYQNRYPVFYAVYIDLTDFSALCESS